MTDKQSDPFSLSAGVPSLDAGLRPKPKLPDRISKRVVVLAIGFVVLLAAIFLVALDQMDNKSAPPPKEQNAKNKNVPEQEGKTPDEIANRNGGKTGPSLIPQNPVPVPAVASLPPAGNIPPAAAGMPPANAIPAESKAPPPPTPEELAEQQAKTERLNRLRQARTTGLVAKGFDVDDSSAAKNAAAGMSANPGSPDFSIQKDLLKMAAAQQGGGGVGPQQASGDHQDEKLEFLKASTKEERSYHPYSPVPQLSENEIKIGSFIPMSLEQGINSDVPGQVTARVSEAIYDTTTGCRMLIPPLSKVIGKYDSKVTLGQDRNLVVWNAMVFPDGSELNLAGMQGYDMAGRAGLGAEVDNHYLRTFGVTFGLSMITAGVSLSVPQPKANSTQVQTPAQTIQMALAQQYGNLGAQIFQKYLNVQPTLTNKPGERFTVMVPNTIIFRKVWRDRCGVATK